MLKLLQAYRFADNDIDHVRRLVHWAELPQGAAVVDLGGGGGYVAALMLDERPDLAICVVDNDMNALARADPRLQTCHSKLPAVPMPDRGFDAAICCYAVGYVDPAAFFGEVYRLLVPNGVAFIVDMVPVDPDRAIVELFGYAIRARRPIETAAAAAGLRLDVFIEPVDASGWGASQWPGYFHIFFGDVRPAVWRFVKI